MRFLLIHTAGAEGGVALADEAVVAVEVLPGRSSSEWLVPVVRRLMEAHRWALRDLTAIAVVHGPGSFTGVRVGLSAAKGFSEAAGIPLIAVSRLALLAGAVDGGGVVHAVLDAGRGEFYYGEYVGRRCAQEALLSGEELRRAVVGGVVVVCEAKVVEALVDLNPLVVAEPSAGDVLPFALDRASVGEFDDTALVDANYLRRTDAELFARSKAESPTR